MYFDEESVEGTKAYPIDYDSFLRMTMKTFHYPKSREEIALKISREYSVKILFKWLSQLYPSDHKPNYYSKYDKWIVNDANCVAAIVNYYTNVRPPYTPAIRQLDKFTEQEKATLKKDILTCLINQLFQASSPNSQPDIISSGTDEQNNLPPLPTWDFTNLYREIQKCLDLIYDMDIKAALIHHIFCCVLFASTVAIAAYYAKLVAPWLGTVSGLATGGLLGVAFISQIDRSLGFCSTHARNYPPELNGGGIPIPYFISRHCWTYPMTALTAGLLGGLSPNENYLSGAPFLGGITGMLGTLWSFSECRPIFRPRHLISRLYNNIMK